MCVLFLNMDLLSNLFDNLVAIKILGDGNIVTLMWIIPCIKKTQFWIDIYLWIYRV